MIDITLTVNAGQVRQQWKTEEIAMGEILRLKKTNCKNCHKCIRNCSVKSIRFTAGQAHIVEDECILCGRCFAVCPQNAKVIASDLEKVKVMLQQPTPLHD